MKEKIHYASSGEWGGTFVLCSRLFITDVYHTGIIKNVTCKKCLKLIEKNKK